MSNLLNSRVVQLSTYWKIKRWQKKVTCEFNLIPSDEPKMSLSGDQLWDPGQEWIQIFDNLLKHPQECKLFLKSQTKSVQSKSCKLFLTRMEGVEK